MTIKFLRVRAGFPRVGRKGQGTKYNYILLLCKNCTQIRTGLHIAFSRVRTAAVLEKKKKKNESCFRELYTVTRDYKASHSRIKIKFQVN